MLGFLLLLLLLFSVGGLLNATCGNATELIIAIFALIHNKVDVVKYSLLGSILSNLLLVLGSSLLCGGIANISKEQKFERVSIYYVFLLKNIIFKDFVVKIEISWNIPTETSGRQLSASVVGIGVPYTSFDVQVGRNVRSRTNRSRYPGVVEG